MMTVEIFNTQDSKYLDHSFVSTSQVETISEQKEKTFRHCSCRVQT